LRERVVSPTGSVSGEIMRAIGFLAVAAMLLSHTASANVKRHSSIPESLWGSWAPIAETCEKASDSIIALAAKSYISSETTCTIDWVSETAGARGATYSAHLQCSSTAAPARKTVSNVVLRPTDTNQLSLGPDFSSLKTYQRCPGTAPGSAR
jgi:hypothetical protein